MSRTSACSNTARSPPPRTNALTTAVSPSAVTSRAKRRATESSSRGERIPGSRRAQCPGIVLRWGVDVKSPVRKRSRHQPRGRRASSSALPRTMARRSAAARQIRSRRGRHALCLQRQQRLINTSISESQTDYARAADLPFAAGRRGLAGSDLRAWRVSPDGGGSIRRGDGHQRDRRHRRQNA